MRFYFFLLTLLFSCTPPSQPSPSLQPPTDQSTTEPIASEKTNAEITFDTWLTSFNCAVEFVFVCTEELSETQKKNYEGFKEKQDALKPEIMKKIFEFYKEAYPDYKLGMSIGDMSESEIERYLPKPTTPGKLEKFIRPVYIIIDGPNDCEEGTLGIEFECTWDIEHGLGVMIKDWKVVEVGPAELVYF